jgi:hypothetical protein
VTEGQEAQLRAKLSLSSLHEINDAIAFLRDLEAVEIAPLPLSLLRYVLQEIHHRFDPDMVERRTWSRVMALAPRFSRILDARAEGDRAAMFEAMNALVLDWMKLHASIG